MLSAEAESAIFSANQMRGLFVGREGTKRRRLRRREAAATRIQLELALGRVVACGENYLLRQATSKLKPELLGPTRPPSPVDPMTSRLRRAAKSIKLLKRLWLAELTINLETMPHWQDFYVLRELRHVLVHRLGRWEPGLDPKPTLDPRVRLLGIEPAIYRGEIPLFRRDLDQGIRTIVDFVDEVDRA
jgi:hypothetical protein